MLNKFAFIRCSLFSRLLCHHHLLDRTCLHTLTDDFNLDLDDITGNEHEISEDEEEIEFLFHGNLDVDENQ